MDKGDGSVCEDFVQLIENFYEFIVELPVSEVVSGVRLGPLAQFLVHVQFVKKIPEGFRKLSGCEEIVGAVAAEVVFQFVQRLEGFLFYLVYFFLVELCIIGGGKGEGALGCEIVMVDSKGKAIIFKQVNLIGFERRKA